jgi:P4 family phage/plasmid primase-like protien
MADNIQDILDKLSTGPNCSAFKKLYFERDTSAYASFEDAERALCKMLAAKTDNAKLIDKMFRQSSICCPTMWDRDGYGKNLIQQVLQASKNTAKVPYFIVQVERNNKMVEKISAPLLADWMREQIHYQLVSDEMNQYSTIYWYRDGVYQEIGENLFKGVIKREIAKYRPEMVKMSIINEVYGLLMTDLEYVSLSKFNADQNIINFKNGVLHLDTMQLKKHDPKYLSSIQIPCNWQQKGSSTQTFDKYLDTLTNGDKEVQAFILAFMGICISNVWGTHFKKGLFFTGPGDTGKSQIKLLLEMLLGERNHFAIDLSGLEARFGTSYVYGKRMVGSADMGFMSLKELRTFKQLTGGDSIMGERKTQQGFTFRYRGCLIFATNKMPVFSGDDGSWVYDRFCIVKCNNVIPVEERDPKLLEKMFSEASGIIYKAVMQLKEVVNNGYKLTEPQAIIEARSEYSRTNNIVTAFAEECLEDFKGPGQNATITTVYDTFLRWCKGNNNGHTCSMADFKRRLAIIYGIPEDDLIKHTSMGNVNAGKNLTQVARLYGWTSPSSQS